MFKYVKRITSLMKIYIAAKFEKKDLVLALRQQLEVLGHTISYDWTTHKNVKPYVENKDMAKSYATNEIEGIAKSDIFIHFAEDRGHTLHMECGAAMMSQKITGKPKVFVVGEWNASSPWYFTELVERVGTVEDVVEKIKQLE